MAVGGGGEQALDLGELVSRRGVLGSPQADRRPAKANAKRKELQEG